MNSIKKISLGLILVLLVSSLCAPKKSYAIFGVADISFDTIQDIEGALTTGTTAITAGATTVQTGLSASQWAKTFVLDPLATAIARQMIRKFTVQTVNWINSGFKGNPAYVTNPDQFFLDVGDRVAGQFLSSNSVLKNLCTPFQAQVRLALVQNYLTETDQNFSCTIDKVVQNYEAFSRDFNQGGWQGWFAISQNSQNNPYGAYLAAKDQLNLSIGNQKTKYNNQLNWGGGFLSFEKCTKRATAANADEYFSKAEGGSSDVVDGTCLASETVTPGSVISDQLKNVLKSPQTQLELTTGINQVVSALMMQMVNQVVGGIGNGLKGLSSKSNSSGSSNSSRSFLEQMMQGSPETQSEDTKIQDDINGLSNKAKPGNPDLNLPDRDQIKAEQEGERNGYRSSTTGGTTGTETASGCAARVSNTSQGLTEQELAQRIESECSGF